MPMVSPNAARSGFQTATYIFKASDGTLLAWGPDAANLVVATGSQMTAAGLDSASGLAPLDLTHVWDPVNKTVATTTNPTTLTYGQFVYLFTPAETVAIVGSGNAQVKQWVEAARGSTINLSDPNVINGVNGLVALGLLTSQRAAQVLANQPHP